MSFQNHGAGVMDGETCRYGTSKLLCRGPLRELTEPYHAFLGGSETFGKFVDRPFATCLEHRLETPCVNLGAVNAGVESFARDEELTKIATSASRCVIQVMGAYGNSNRYYRVHSRRNDRIIEVMPALVKLFPEVDFAEVNFAKHLLGALQRESRDRFEVVKEELRNAWMDRMRYLLGTFERKPTLLWLRYPETIEDGLSWANGREPLFVTARMLDGLADLIDNVITVEVLPAGESNELESMIVAPFQVPAAEHALGPRMHNLIADALEVSLKRTQD